MVWGASQVPEDQAGPMGDDHRKHLGVCKPANIIDDTCTFLKG